MGRCLYIQLGIRHRLDGAVSDCESWDISGSWLCNVLRGKKESNIAWCSLSVKRQLFCDLVQYHTQWSSEDLNYFSLKQIAEKQNPGELVTKVLAPTSVINFHLRSARDYKFHEFTIPTSSHAISIAYFLFLAAEDLRNIFPSLGPRKKILNSTHLLPLIHIKNIEMTFRLTLRPPFMNKIKNTQDGISSGLK